MARRMDYFEMKKVEYLYRAFEPIIFDARTLHSVARSISSEWRIVLWFIFDSF